MLVELAAERGLLRGLPEPSPLISLFTLLLGEVLIGVRTFLSDVRWNVSAWPLLEVLGGVVSPLVASGVVTEGSVGICATGVDWTAL